MFAPKSKICAVLLLFLVLAHQGGGASAAENRDEALQVRQDASNRTEKKDDTIKSEVKLPFKVEQDARLLNHDVYPGDPITMQVKFSADNAFIAEVFGDLPLGGFELDDKRIERSQEGGKYFVTFFFDLLTFETGMQAIPKIPFRLRDSSGNEEMRDSGELRIDVKSVLMEEVQKQAMRIAKEQAVTGQGQGRQPGSKLVAPGSNDPIGPTFNVPVNPDDPNVQNDSPSPDGGPTAPQAQGASPEQQVKVEPRDIKGVVDLIEKDYTIAYVFATFLGAALLLLVLWLLLKRRSQVEETLPPEPVDTRPAHVIALERLQGLERRNMIARRQLKEFHLEVSDILRDYFERRFGFGASSMSTEEVMDVLRDLYMKGLDERLVEAMLLRCDLVKFAKFTPDDESSLKLLKDSYVVVERTKEEEAGNGVR